MSTPLPETADPLVIVVPVRTRSRWYLVVPLLLAVGALALFAWRMPPDENDGGKDLVRFFARMHPALTHLPIAGLFLMPVFDLLGSFKRWRYLWASGQLLMWFATLGVVLAAAAGYLLAQTEGTNDELVLDHMWAGIMTAAAACLALMFRSLARGGTRRAAWAVLYLLALLGTLVGLSFAAHQGGSITHGEDFISKYAPEPLRSWISDVKSEVKDAADRARPDVVLPATLPVPSTAPTSTRESVDLSIEDRTVFAAIVQPVFAQHCVECHGTRKVKGDLRLDTFEHALAGGESGSTLVPGSVADSELARLIDLPRTDHDAMPPKEKPALSAAEIDAIKWWIANGASDTLRLAEAGTLPDHVKSLAR